MNRGGVGTDKFVDMVSTTAEVELRLSDFSHALAHVGALGGAAS